MTEPKPDSVVGRALTALYRLDHSKRGLVILYGSVALVVVLSLALAVVAEVVAG